jgi:hypothetical protein
MGGHLHVVVLTGLGKVSMIMRVGLVVDVLDGTRGRFVDMNDAHGVIRVGQAWRRESAIG